MELLSPWMKTTAGPSPLRCTFRPMPLACRISAPGPSAEPWAWGLTTAPSAGSIRPRTVPTSTTSPSATTTLTTPSTSAVISAVALSVSTSRMTWPDSTESPSRTCQRDSLPSLIPIPILGMMTSIGIGSFLNSFSTGSRRPPSQDGFPHTSFTAATTFCGLGR